MKVAIIGGSGKMGRWFANFLLGEGKEVVITGRNERKLLEAKQQLGVEIATNEEAVKYADLVLLSVPIDNFESVVEEVAPYIRAEQSIIDITSIKVFPVKAIHKHIKTGLVLGTHPMFGPGARSIAGQNFVLTPTNEEERAFAQKVEQYLVDRGAKVALMTPHEHDEMMAVILGFSHFVAIVSADTLSSLDKFEMTRAISGTSFRVLQMLMESVISEEPEFYASLQMSLPMAEIEVLFQKNSETWAKIVQNKDRGEFIRKMNMLKTRFKEDNPDFGKAYDTMYRLLDQS